MPRDLGYANIAETRHTDQFAEVMDGDDVDIAICDTSLLDEGMVMLIRDLRDHIRGCDPFPDAFGIAGDADKPSQKDVELLKKPRQGPETGLGNR